MAIRLTLTIIASSAVLSVTTAFAATFWPEEASALTDAEIAQLTRMGDAKLVGQFVVIDDMEFRLDHLKLAGFSAKPWPGARLIYDARGLTRPERDGFLRACAWWQNVSRVRCVARTNQSGGYTRVLRSSGNRAGVGYPGSRYTSNIRISNFNNTGTVAHEIGHALGLSHEQCRSDRDQYVTIHDENILSDAKGNFTKRNTTNYGSYDFRSILHYGDYAWTKNGRRTITVKPPNQNMQNVIGRRASLSTADAAGMRDRYQNVR